MVRNAMLIFQGLADISFVGRIKIPACWWGWSCTVIQKENLESCSKATKGALTWWMWHAYNYVGTKLAVNQTCACLPVLLERVYVLHWLPETDKGFKRQAQEKIECHSKHFQTPFQVTTQWLWVDPCQQRLSISICDQISLSSCWLQSHVNHRSLYSLGYCKQRTRP